LFLSGIFGVFNPLFIGVFIWIALTYLVVSMAYSAAISTREGWKYFPLLPISFGALHFGYGIGFIRGVGELLFQRKVRQ
jgi:hypothetical protein